MSDPQSTRSSRDETAEEQATLPKQFGAWFSAMLRGRGDTTLRDAIEGLIEDADNVNNVCVVCSKAAEGGKGR